MSEKLVADIHDTEDVTSVEKIDDAKIIHLLNRLDQLESIKIEPKKIIFQKFIETIFEIFKFAAAGACVMVVLSTERGQQIASKAIPALGFGNSAQTNIGLGMLVGQISEEEFEQTILEVRRKIDFEISVIFSNDLITGPVKRLELLRQVKGYAFSNIGIDLSYEVNKKLKDKYAKLETSALEAIDYSLQMAISDDMKEKKLLLKEMKKLLLNRKYIELLEKSLPHWYEGHEMVRTSLVAMIAMDKEAPEVLDKIISRSILSDVKHKVKI